ncbi:hypothetical protein Q4Q49_16490 [Shewanella sp. SP1S1-7]|uniref:hypothetical protein n=1 Tax=Shewanella sp. SP1S1-7 TaxID=3063536 RepID=UPI00288DD1A9|nr:hypothetical protein [Shewanella sp. SP1S1-7]MDT3336884.1 hypothetical protein [Shewanella sp. SP1S1-7]
MAAFLYKVDVISVYYSLYNLTIDSDFPLTHLPCSQESHPTNISIKQVDKLDVDVALLNQVGAYCWLNSSSFLLSIPRLADFYVRDGQSIVVAVADDADMALVLTYIQGYMLAVVMQQRGQLVLHGTVLQKKSIAIAVCGHSGSGKSALAATLLTQGWQLVSDDVCVFNTDGKVLQGCRALHVWPDVAEVLQLSETEPLAATMAKLQYVSQVPIMGNDEANARLDAFPLVAVYCLSEQQDDDQSDTLEEDVFAGALSEFKGMRKFAPLKANRYRTQFATAMGQDALFMQQCSAFLANTPVYGLSRGKAKLSLANLHALSDLISDSFEALV